MGLEVAFLLYGPGTLKKEACFNKKNRRTKNGLNIYLGELSYCIILMAGLKS